MTLGKAECLGTRSTPMARRNGNNNHASRRQYQHARVPLSASACSQTFRFSVLSQLFLEIIQEIELIPVGNLIRCCGLAQNIQ